MHVFHFKIHSSKSIHTILHILNGRTTQPLFSTHVSHIFLILTLILLNGDLEVSCTWQTTAWTKEQQAVSPTGHYGEHIGRLEGVSCSNPPVWRDTLFY